MGKVVKTSNLEYPNKSPAYLSTSVSQSHGVRTWALRRRVNSGTLLDPRRVNGPQPSSTAGLSSLMPLTPQPNTNENTLWLYTKSTSWGSSSRGLLAIPKDSVNQKKTAQTSTSRQAHPRYSQFYVLGLLMHNLQNRLTGCRGAFRGREDSNGLLSSACVLFTMDIDP